MKKIISLAAVLTMLATGAAFAGSPDNPGVGGRLMSETQQILHDQGSNQGREIKEWRENVDPNFSLGTDAVQPAKNLNGGAPNPANDKGGGND